MKKLRMKIAKMKENKIFKVSLMIVNTLFTILVICILAVVLVQRFSNNKFNLGGVGIYTVITGSMVPEYEVGDMILAKEVEPKSIEIGNNVVYLGDSGAVNGKIITHKVTKKEYRNGEYYFVTKGVANPFEDDEISSDQIKGVVKYHFGVLSFLSHIVNSTYGFYFIIFVPFVIFIFFEIIGVSKDMKKEDEDGCDKD